LTPSEILYNQGFQAFAQRQYAKANQLFQNAAALEPNSSCVQCAYGITLLFQGDYAKAAAALQRGGELARKEKIDISLEPFTSSKDFAYRQKRLSQILERNPENDDAKILFLMLTNAANHPTSTPPTPSTAK